ncbi:glycerophosphodiester phosphodiesterase [Bacillus sp. YC2]|uniref:glycerophosphodiester phosphodiesterase n=1 Tax=Bacillus sp. YC2 TaxID=2861287 RepID=UPI001CA740B3|nr:glycerophosphodiester phosphodiesterase [Bacillus sp. YC2]MBY8913388.1 glycerophosphodiester phosphodiesterase [Bacillus sp. YC2]
MRKNRILALVLLSFGLLSFIVTPVSAKGKGNLLSPDRVLTIAHRGASGYVPEHTMLSYETARKMKADYIEMDLQMTKDGKLIVMHDEKLDRTTNGHGWVKDHTLAEIKKLDAGSWFNKAYPEKAKPQYAGLKVPTLDEVLKRYGRHANYYIETKAPEIYPGMEEKLIASLKKYKLTGKHAKTGQVIIQSFSKDSLLKIKTLDPKLPTVQLLEAEQLSSMTDADLTEIKTYAVGIGPDYKALNAENVRTIRNHGLLLHPYTVNTEADMRRLLNWGVTGVFTNYADVFQQVKKDYKK